MANLKGKSEGGAGGKRGHSNMDHWGYTAEVKDAARKRRRLDSKEIISHELDEMERDVQRNLRNEERRATRMLRGKTVKHIRRHRPGEVLVEFTDGTRLFVDAQADEVELSITE